MMMLIQADNHLKKQIYMNYLLLTATQLVLCMACQKEKQAIMNQSNQPLVSERVSNGFRVQPLHSAMI
jgi:hypothetical protein